MNIGIDIDGVLTNLEEYIVQYGSEFANQNNLQFDYTMKTNWFGFISREDNGKFWTKHWFIYANNARVNNNASNVIKMLKDKGHNIVLITARTYDPNIINQGPGSQQKMEKCIIDWLGKNDIIYDKLVFANIDKVPYYKENKIDIMLDDSPRNINDIILNTNVKPYVYNAKYNEDVENAIRVYDWCDFYKKVI